MVSVFHLCFIRTNQDIQMNNNTQQDHSQQIDNQQKDKQQEGSKKSRFTLILLAAFLALPYLVVFIYQAYPELSVKTGMSNKGHLFSPVHSLEQVATEDFEKLKGNWTIIYVSGKSCDQECYNQHYTMRQVRLASAKRRYKIQRLNLITGDAIDAAYTEMLAEFPDEKQIVLNYNDKIMQQVDELSIEQQTGRIYLMDPYLNIVLRYPVQTNPKDLLHDINKLIME
jgi:cytochrome oxidase Cu insertion factor (SCO1/SenC/PrrC family)